MNRYRVIVKITYPNSGGDSWFCHVRHDPVGCVIYDGSGYQNCEPRLVSATVGQNVGNLSEGVATPQRYTLQFTSDPDGAGTVDLLGDLYTKRIDGATVTIWAGVQEVDSLSELTQVFVGRVAPVGAVMLSPFSGLIALQIEDAFGFGDRTLTNTTFDSADAEGLKGLIIPVVFGIRDVTGTPSGFPVYAFLTGISGTNYTFQIGDPIGSGTPEYSDPDSVALDGATVPAHSPITDPPSAGEWGSWNGLTGKFVINTSSLSWTDESVVVVNARGLQLAGADVADLSDTVETVFDACGYTAGTDFSTVALGTWASSLPSGFGELHGVFPLTPTREPVRVETVLKAAMARTASVMRRASDGKWDIVYPGRSGGPELVVYPEDLIDLKITLDPGGEYCNQIEFQNEFAAKKQNRIEVTTITDTTERTDTDREVLKVLAGGGDDKFRLRLYSAATAAFRDLYTQRLWVVEATIGPVGLDLLPGDRVEFRSNLLPSWFPATVHLRSVTVDLNNFIVQIRGYGILYP